MIEMLEHRSAHKILRGIGYPWISTLRIGRRVAFRPDETYPCFSFRPFQRGWMASPNHPPNSVIHP